ncbi:MAG TPA: permease-like cell division protein FtsX [Candidatus Baltobacteraceae bacterium]
MQATAIGTVAVTVALLGAFVFVRVTLAGLGTQILDQIEISVYMKADATPSQVAAARSALARDPRVASVEHVSRAAGLAQLRQETRGVIDMSIISANFLPEKLRVRAKNLDNVPAIAASIGKIRGVDNVVYNPPVVQRLLQLGTVMRRIGIAVIAIFVLVAGIIISNTIRLTVFARRREIAIMQLVGATNFYIRLPFICEGFLDGILGSALAVVVLAIVKTAVWQRLLEALPWAALGSARFDAPLLALELLVVGGALGIVASWISVGRYLRA